MQRWSVALAMCICLLAAGAAAGSWWKAAELRSEARWLMARGSAQASEFAHTFEDKAAEGQLRTFAQRRQVLEQAHRWQRGQTFGVLVAVLAAACGWVLRMWNQLRGQIAEAGQELEDLEGVAEESEAIAAGELGRLG